MISKGNFVVIGYHHGHTKVVCMLRLLPCGYTVVAGDYGIDTVCMGFIYKPYVYTVTIVDTMGYAIIAVCAKKSQASVKDISGGNAVHIVVADDPYLCPRLHPFGHNLYKYVHTLQGIPGIVHITK